MKPHVLNSSESRLQSSISSEVRLPQGNEVLDIFKNYAAKTSILDDFDFYENREKVLVQKKLRLHPVQIKKKEEADVVADFKSMEISNYGWLRDCPPPPPREVRPPRVSVQLPPRTFTTQPRPLKGTCKGAWLPGEGAQALPRVATPACLRASCSFALSAI
ncbi:hypothetical protein F2Q70_00016478 [Brassica cretica]|uniref:YTH domain-containing family protein n=1 Tax=Brassica cretica TaxID=69181 RepID=A0A8S9I3Z6_BRACR|nr:hypothetical protein F2Q70_00016478 [Brassica cretica]